MTSFKCTEVEVNGKHAEKIKQGSSGAVLQRNVLDTSGLDLAVMVSDADASENELVVTLRLKRETEYIEPSVSKKVKPRPATVE